VKQTRKGATLLALVTLLLGTSELQAGEEKAPAPPQAKADPDGFVIQSADGAYRLRLGGYVQLDGRFYSGDEAQLGVDTFLLRRVRPIVQGTVARYVDFYLNPDFGGGQTVLQDAYLDAHYHPALRLRVGKFKTPFGLERLQSGSALLFVERALPTALAPNRDLGAQLHGVLAGGVVSYAAGVFNGVTDGGSADGDTNDGKELAGRLWLQPFKRQKGKGVRNLGFGFAATRGHQEGALPSYKTGGQLAFFSYASGVTAAGTRTRISAQASWTMGPVGVLGEWMRSSQEVSKSATAPSLRLDHRAWQVALAFVLTGEDTTLGTVRPRHAFESGQGWGALELTARVNGFDVDGDAFAAGLADPARSARAARAWGVGFNWYLNRHLKQTLDYERTTFTGGAGAGSDRKPENALFFRSQITF